MKSSSNVEQSDKLSRLLSGLEMAGVKRGERNKVVAVKTGYALGTVTRVLSGNSSLTDRFIWAVGSAFGVNPRWVALGEDNPIVAPAPEPHMTPEDMERVDREVFGLVSEEREGHERTILTVLQKRWLTDEELAQVERLVSDLMDRKQGGK